MPIFNDRDSCIITIQKCEDGYFTQYQKWAKTPPPVRTEEIPRYADDPDFQAGRLQQDRISADKAALKTELQQFIDTYFDA